MAEEPTRFDFDGEVDMDSHYETWKLVTALIKWGTVIVAVTLLLMFLFLT